MSIKCGYVILLVKTYFSFYDRYICFLYFIATLFDQKEMHCYVLFNNMVRNVHEQTPVVAHFACIIRATKVHCKCELF
jgi:hypothetical protein